jgi:thymidylate synthase
MKHEPYARIIVANNVNDALESGLWHLAANGQIGGSRNGPVLVAPGPVTTEYLNPTYRVLFSEQRDANPFFHLFESMWMLAGRNDTNALKPFVPRMQDFSDDQETLNGAYGYRWREFFGYDQLVELTNLLKRDPSTRRAVLSMWNAAAYEGYGWQADLTNQGSKDLPCNTHVYFDASRGYLDMTVCCRSNDVVWGAYGANVVHFSFLHEWMAAAAGLHLGRYYQMSNNYHIYYERPDVQRLIKVDPAQPRVNWFVNYRHGPNPYLFAENRVRPLLAGDEAHSATFFLREMEEWVEMGGGLAHPTYSFTRDVLNPMIRAHDLYKYENDIVGAEDVLRQMVPCDWKTAGLKWLATRRQRRQAAANTTATKS